jgi:dihydroorotase
MIARDLALADMTGTRIHICHVSTAGAVELIRRGKEQGIRVTAEVTPHHLTLTQECVMGIIDDKPYTTRMVYDTAAKVNPPLRTSSDIDALIQGLKDGTIDAIATDHAPHRLVDKQCEFDLAAFGISGLETTFGCLMMLVRDNLLSLEDILAKLTVEPARIIGAKYSTLGSLNPGNAADITIIDTDKEWIVDSQTFISKGKNTPFDGYSLKGKPVATILNGNITYQDTTIGTETVNG